MRVQYLKILNPKISVGLPEKETIRMKTTFVFGAGADSGIFPLTNHLVTSINSYLTKTPEGIEVDTLLKRKLGFTTFSYASIMDNASYSFIHRNDRMKANRLRDKIGEIRPENLSEEQKSQLAFIKCMTDTLLPIPRKTRDAEPMQNHADALELSEKAGLKKKVTVCPETTVSKFCRQSIRMLLHRYLDDPENKVLHVLFKCTVNLDEILLEYFLGFYNGNQADIRRYEYLLWTMWAFFVNRETRHHEDEGKTRTIYSLVRGCPVITLNYTTLAATCPESPEVIHFHGSVLDYIDCRTRNEKRIPSFEGIRTLAETKKTDAASILRNEILPLIEVHRGKGPHQDSCVIPSMMPPFEIKPIIANDLIDTWHHAFSLLRESRNIVVVGYSFNHTDAHFNDIILDLAGKRNENGEWEKQIYIINPDVKSIRKYIDSIEQLADCQWTESRLNGTSLNSMTKGNISFIPATTWELLEKSNSLSWLGDA